ncbi:hypothetical protein P154DRAFT_254107 [Amniculicola lignicola CBS 123094]|uniref:Uncharacterized protein n=1 Tax=Amniculicola lignicola CBS 123094 TaxID=1392246 RepID=A0A6A5WWM5_9PLEO|nr:hypothetical protein P154DRAFT_254107 [Amniculicola lignicola CBS 123094]
MEIDGFEWVRNEGWTYTRALRAGIDIPLHNKEHTLRLLRPSTSHFSEDDIYSQFNFRRFPCRKSGNCIENFFNIEDRNRHDKTNSCVPFDPRRQADAVPRLLGYFCRNLECQESQNTASQRDTHERSCQYTEPLLPVFIGVRDRIPCRDCGQFFETVNDRDHHEDFICISAYKICRYRGCYATFTERELRKSHEATCPHMSRGSTRESASQQSSPEKDDTA